MNTNTKFGSWRFYLRCFLCIMFASYALDSYHKGKIFEAVFLGSGSAVAAWDVLLSVWKRTSKTPKRVP